MAFSVQQQKLHSARFIQNILVLKNRSWDGVKMRWHKPDEKFQGQPPHVQVNL